MANGWASMAEADRFYPEQIWDALEAKGVIGDWEQYQRTHLVRPERK